MHTVKATVYNVDTMEDEIVECEVSDDLYKIITNGLGMTYSVDAGETASRHIAVAHWARDDDFGSFCGEYEERDRITPFASQVTCKKCHQGMSK